MMPKKTIDYQSDHLFLNLHLVNLLLDNQLVVNRKNAWFFFCGQNLKTGHMRNVMNIGSKPVINRVTASLKWNYWDQFYLPF